MDAVSPQSRAFLGVRFVLAAFRNDDYCRNAGAKLVGGDGVGVGRHGPNCTHVIVHGLVYDDPVCMAARKNGNMVVTALWVDHGCDIGMAVDATSIMYRPLKDMNGIPGAASLMVCFTGYQRQDRDDIMTMVRLIGAQFSKPLVANKVTHLICYKFEGEKYELAKKMKKIKLVKHQWVGRLFKGVGNTFGDQLQQEEVGMQQMELLHRSEASPDSYSQRSSSTGQRILPDTRVWMKLDGLNVGLPLTLIAATLRQRLFQKRIGFVPNAAFRPRKIQVQPWMLQKGKNDPGRAPKFRT